MDHQLLDAICERLVSSLHTKDTFIVREGDPVNEMLFIIRGEVESSTTDGGRVGFFNSITLGAGDFCGEELLTWALVPTPSLNLPSSTRTVKTLSEVEAFALRAEDLKFVSTQFKRLHSKKLQHAFRYPYLFCEKFDWRNHSLSSEDVPTFPRSCVFRKSVNWDWLWCKTLSGITPTSGGLGGRAISKSLGEDSRRES